MGTFGMIIQFLVFFILVCLISKRYTTLFLLLFIDAYFFNLFGRVFHQPYTQTDISYVTQSLAQPFIELYEQFTGTTVVLSDQQNLLIFLVVWGIIIFITVLEHGIDQRYLKRYHVKEEIESMRRDSKNASIQYDFVNEFKKNYQYIYLDSIYYLHIFSYQYHVSKNKCIHQRIKIHTIQNMELKPVEKGYQLLIYLVNGQILDGGIYQKKHYQQLTKMIPKVLEQRQNSQVQSATVFGKPIDKKEA